MFNGISLFVDCWPVFLHWLYQCLLILILVLGCVSIFSFVFIQIRHTYLLPPQAWGRLWQGCWFCFLYLSSPIDWLCSWKLSQVFLVHSFIDQLIGFNLLLVHPVGVDPRRIEAHCSNLLITLEDNFELVPPVWRVISSLSIFSSVVITVPYLVFQKYSSQG